MRKGRDIDACLLAYMFEEGGRLQKGFTAPTENASSGTVDIPLQESSLGQTIIFITNSESGEVSECSTSFGWLGVSKFTPLWVQAFVLLVCDLHGWRWDGMAE